MWLSLDNGHFITGGGSIASGGAGIVGGTVVLGGVVIGAIAVVGGVLAAAKGKARLSEAKRIHAEAESAVSKMNVVITSMEGIESVSENYRDFISKLSGLFTPYLQEMDSIASKYQRGRDGKVDFNDLSEVEQKTLHLSWLLAQLYYHILSVPLLNEQGEIEPSSRRLLQKARQDYAQLSGQVSQLENEKKTIHDLLTGAQKGFSEAYDSYYKQKEATTHRLIDIGKKRVALWESTFSPFMEALSHFENITVNSIYPYSVTDIPIEFIFESCDSVLSYIRRIKQNGENIIGDTGYVEIGLFGGEDFLSELSQLEDEQDAIHRVHRHDMSLWFTGELDPSISDNVPFDEVSDYYISVVKQTIEGISGRENLAEATEISQDVKQLENKIKSAIADFDATAKKYKTIDDALRKYNTVQSRFLNEIENIRMRHQSGESIVQYESLTESEKKVFEMSFVIAKMQYTILASCILPQSNGGDADDSDFVIDVADKAYTSIKKDTFKIGESVDSVTADLIWKESADKMMYAGFAVCACFIVLMIAQLKFRSHVDLIALGGVILAIPLFFIKKDLPQSKLFMWRGIRILAAIVIVIVAEIMMVV